MYTKTSQLHQSGRGAYPSDRIRAPRGAFDQKNMVKEVNKIGIWQGLADLDPDVDAIYRLTSNKEVTFDKGDPIVLGKETWCPFNSQNTLFASPQFFPLLYLPAFVTFRFTDILRGYVAQPILQAAGYRLGFTEATVYQDRNALTILHVTLRMRSHFIYMPKDAWTYLWNQFPKKNPLMRTCLRHTIAYTRKVLYQMKNSPF